MKLKHDKLRSNFDFNCNLRHYTQDPFIVYTSNIFAILSLRSLYAFVATLVAELEYLQTAVAAVLGFVGCKVGTSHTPPRLTPLRVLGPRFLRPNLYNMTLPRHPPRFKPSFLESNGDPAARWWRSLAEWR